MKKTIVIFSLLVGGIVYGQTVNNLDILFKAKQFNELNGLNTNFNHPDYYFYKAVYANVCNHPKLANEYLDSLQIGKLSSGKLFDYWTLRNDCYVKLCDYKRAYNTNELLNRKFKEYYSTTELAENIETEKIWKEASVIPAQRIEYKGMVIVPVVHDKAGLITVKVTSNHQVADFVFDTGAGLSVITESYALKLGLKMYGKGDIKVKGFTGVGNITRIATTDSLKMGDVVIYHPLFIVFKDEALSFANGAYKINGIIGFPVAKDLGTIIIQKNSLEIGHTKYEGHKNLFIDMLNPIVMLKYRNKEYPFNLDTGADKTSLSKTFYELMKNDDLIKSLPVQISKTASAGGEINYKSLLIPTLGLQLGNQNIEFKNAKMDIDNYHISGKALFGNIGQDLLKKYDKIIISFDNNYLKLE